MTLDFLSRLEIIKLSSEYKFSKISFYFRRQQFQKLQKNVGQIQLSDNIEKFLREARLSIITDIEALNKF